MTTPSDPYVPPASAAYSLLKPFMFPGKVGIQCSGARTLAQACFTPDEASYSDITLSLYPRHHLGNEGRETSWAPSPDVAKR